MEITFTTPALLFPAISLLLLAYTNRFVALASLVRKLHEQYKRGEENKIIVRQIHSLRRRLRLVRSMQTLGVFSFVCSSNTSLHSARRLLSLLASLIISLIEIAQSTRALELELSDIEEPESFFSELIKKKEEKPGENN